MPELLAFKLTRSIGRIPLKKIERKVKRTKCQSIKVILTFLHVHILPEINEERRRGSSSKSSSMLDAIIAKTNIFFGGIASTRRTDDIKLSHLFELLFFRIFEIRQMWKSIHWEWFQSTNQHTTKKWNKIYAWRNLSLDVHKNTHWDVFVVSFFYHKMITGKAQKWSSSILSFRRRSKLSFLCKFLFLLLMMNIRPHVRMPKHGFCENGNHTYHRVKQKRSLSRVNAKRKNFISGKSEGRTEWGKKCCPTVTFSPLFFRSLNASDQLRK